MDLYKYDEWCASLRDSRLGQSKCYIIHRQPFWFMVTRQSEDNVINSPLFMLSILRWDPRPSMLGKRDEQHLGIFLPKSEAESFLTANTYLAVSSFLFHKHGTILSMAWGRRGTYENGESTVLMPAEMSLYLVSVVPLPHHITSEIPTFEKIIRRPCPQIIIMEWLSNNQAYLPYCDFQGQSLHEELIC